MTSTFAFQVLRINVCSKVGLSKLLHSTGDWLQLVLIFKIAGFHWQKTKIRKHIQKFIFADFATFQDTGIQSFSLAQENIILKHIKYYIFWFIKPNDYKSKSWTMFISF